VTDEDRTFPSSGMRTEDHVQCASRILRVVLPPNSPASNVVCSGQRTASLLGGQILRSKRRVRQEPSVTRALLLDATERLMVREGYAAVTTRRVASKVGLTGALVHYYYPTTDDLLLAAYRRAVERYDQRIREALASRHPLHALWNILTDSSHMALGVEFMALANHRKIVRKEIVQHDERARKFQADALSGILADAGIDPKMCPPSCAVMVMEGMSRAFVMEEVLGISFAHSETRAFVERLLRRAESTRKPRKQIRERASSTPVRRRGSKREALGGYHSI
jgi:AcrR family transcriptional regulator